MFSQALVELIILCTCRLSLMVDYFLKYVVILNGELVSKKLLLYAC